MEPKDGGRQAKASTRRGPVAAIIAVAVVIAVLLLVSQAIVRHNALQNCLDAGRRDCGDRPS